jgi:hypothetical protein
VFNGAGSGTVCAVGGRGQGWTGKLAFELAFRVVGVGTGVGHAEYVEALWYSAS